MRLNFAKRIGRAGQSFLSDNGGNVLMIAAASLIPLLGIIGSGVDIGRAYMTKIRLQQACDAGVLAGRRAMAHGGYTDIPKGEASKMFYFNFPLDTYGVQNLSFTSDSNGASDVEGTAQASLPTALMHIFGVNNFNLEVACGAKLEIANTDIMMVLDVTGSMVLSRSTKLDDLKSASNLFLTTLMKADASGSRIRIGVVPYALTVNIGDVLRSSNKMDWISGSDVLPSLVYVKKEGPITTTKSRRVCNKNGRDCQNRNVTYTYYNHVYSRQNVSNYNLAPLKNGTNVQFPVGEAGSKVDVKWDGCITEVDTTATSATSSFNLSSAKDMDINHVPGSTAGTKWKMYLPQLVFERPGVNAQEVRIETDVTISGNTYIDGVQNPATFANTLASYQAAGGHDVGCPVPAMKLTEMNSSGQTAFKNKIESLEGHGYTYHDVGIAWGGRLISPKGIFRSENEFADNKKPISRHIIFMTDGEMQTNTDRYSHQGVEKMINRVGSTSETDSNARHINRFKRLCNYVKDEGITIWVVAFGFPAENKRTTAQKANFANLASCASPGLMYEPEDGQTLADVFASIAGQIARLRVSQ